MYSYGQKGAELILYTIFSLIPKRRTVVDALAPIDYYHFVDHIIFPYTACRLIAVDLGISLENAHAVMLESQDLGDLRHPLKEDGDGDDDDDDEEFTVAKFAFTKAFKSTGKQSEVESRWGMITAEQQAVEAAMQLNNQKDVVRFFISAININAHHANFRKGEYPSANSAQSCY
jgi:hypothetical protein